MKFIIDFKNDTAAVEIQSYLATYNCEVVKTFSAFDQVYLVEAEIQPVMSEIVESILEDSENQLNLLSTMSWSTSSLDDWWKVASAYKPDLSVPVISYEKPSVNSVVYMIDSGIDLSHPEFVNSRVENLYSFNNDFTDYNGHGTALSSLIVGETCGIVDATVKSVKIFQNGTPTLLSALLSAFDAIYSDSQQHSTGMKILNMSWSIAKNQYIENKIQQLIDNGFVAVTSSGNDGSPIENVTPASMIDAITVGAYNHDFEPCDFSNYTGYLNTADGLVNYGALDIWAPGKDIKVANLNGDISFTSGTSVAAAIQSAALLFNSQYRQLSDGSVPGIYQAKNGILGNPIESRSGILSLTGQYENSVNTITTLLTEKSGENGSTMITIFKMTLKVVDGEALPGVSYFPKTVFQSYDASVLPEGLYVDNGFILGTMSVPEASVIRVEVPVVYVDGSQGTVPLVIIALPKGITGQEPDLDPEIAIQLQAACTGTSCDGDCTQLNPTCGNCSNPLKQFNCRCYDNLC